MGGLMGDIPKALIALVAVGVLLTIPYKCATAGEWFPEAAVYLDVTPDTGDIYCHRSDGHTGHLGARLDLYTHGPHTVRTIWVHESCAEEQNDNRSRDAIGIGYEYQLW